MHIKPFKTEQFYAQYEFSAPHLLSVSDCETVTTRELLTMANLSPDDLANVSLGYTQSQGDPALREQIAATYGDQISAEQIVLLNAPMEGIFLALHALLERDDEVIVLTPTYDSLIDLPEHVAGSVQRWALGRSATGYFLDFATLPIADKTKLIVVNLPNNPTGFLPSATEFERLLSIAARLGAWVFCDEMYRGLAHNGRESLPTAPQLYARAIALSGLSKAYGLAGLRVGWLVVRDGELRERILNWKFYTTICPPAPSEFLAQAALSVREALWQRNRQIIADNLRLARPFFDKHRAHLTFREPTGASVALVEIDAPSALDYCHQLAREAGVVLLPASFMGMAEAAVRIGFGRKSFPAALAAYDAYLNR
jgi:aspartate/methionine/tyrosine aminotransferase